MGEVSVTVTAITTIGSLISTVGVALISYQQYKLRLDTQARQREVDQREALRAESCMIQLEMLQAQLKLGMVTAKAVLNKKTNGDVEDAMELVEKAETKFAKYLRKLATEVEVS